MTSPVLQALAQVQQRERDSEISALVYAELGLPRETDGAIPEEFANWCAARGASFLPARPDTVALFVLRAPAGTERLPALLNDISAAHQMCGLADPTTTWPVPAAMSHVMRIEPPRSWPKEEKRRFLELPYHLQCYFAAHDSRREKEIRRAQNEVAVMKQKLKASESTNAETEVAA